MHARRRSTISRRSTGVARTTRPKARAAAFVLDGDHHASRRLPFLLERLAARHARSQEPRRLPVVRRVPGNAPGQDSAAHSAPGVSGRNGDGDDHALFRVAAQRARRLPQLMEPGAASPADGGLPEPERRLRDSRRRRVATIAATAATAAAASAAPAASCATPTVSSALEDRTDLRGAEREEQAAGGSARCTPPCEMRARPREARLLAAGAHRPDHLAEPPARRPAQARDSRQRCREPQQAATELSSI
jgi:hypothetical protein